MGKAQDSISGFKKSVETLVKREISPSELDKIISYFNNEKGSHEQKAFNAIDKFCRRIGITEKTISFYDKAEDVMHEMDDVLEGRDKK